MAFGTFPVVTEGEFTLQVELAGCTVEEKFWILHRDLTATLEHLAAQPPVQARPPAKTADAGRAADERPNAQRKARQAAPAKAAPAKKRRAVSAG
jgi:hypothetical protein